MCQDANVAQIVVVYMLPVYRCAYEPEVIYLNLQYFEKTQTSPMACSLCVAVEYCC